jgi:hypothetical protein
MRALVLSCTLKPSPAASNTEALAGVVTEALVDVGYTSPGQAWTYWNRGPGPGDSYLDTDEGTAQLEALRQPLHQLGRARRQHA